MKRENIQSLALSAMFLAIGLVLPFLTGQIRQIGNMLLPMHIPVMLCGLICGWKYGLIVGFVTPLFRSVLFGMPVMFPNAVAMAWELMVYGGLAGYLYQRSRWHCVVSLYRCLIVAMISGRVMWGIVQMILLGLGENGFTMKAFLTGAVLNAIPGIILQLVLIPAIMIALNKTGLVPFGKIMRHKSKRTNTPIDEPN